MNGLDEYGISPEQAWLGTFVAGVVALAGSALVFTERVYYGFIWRYFWGPVAADADGARCVAYLRDSGDVVFNPAAGCGVVENAYVAEPGYTTVSTIGYMVVLVFMLWGVYLLLQRFDLRPYPDFFLSLVPFMLFGGALRVVEDSFVAAQRAGADPAVGFPASGALISPFIYFTVFFVTLVAFLLAKWLQWNDHTETYSYPLGAMGAGIFLLTAGYLTMLSVTRDYVGWYPLVTVTTVGLATLLAVGAYYGLDRYAPEVNAGTGTMGLVVVWGHAIDGVANVIASDWTGAFGIPGEGYSAKHVVNRIIIDVTNAVQPAWLTDIVGDSWTFLVVKLIVAVFILSVFDEQFFDESPRYAVLLLMAILAVGLGPGTRDMIRVTLGI
ncbi:DUF63 family protein [Salinibaculum rarum]|uniref:DUF63 family protein n=1 Tax=Salinibaculum rarum TaxID=3058903 RepID=UPI00265E4F49|nr:DUF63 family protein [Salinibaculum sp. KK48]